MKRSNDEIDMISERLLSHLREELNDSGMEYDSPLTQLQGGFETAIYRFHLKGAQKVPNKRLVLRLYPELYDPANVFWEGCVQNALAKERYPVAEVHFICTDKSILGGAFFIMDFLSGEPMITAPMETIPGNLGKAHAALHGIDPESLIKSLNEQGVDKNTCRVGNRFNWLKDRASELPWIRDGPDWLIDNCPPEPARLAVCHGDFHPLNILIQDGKITGVIDWSSFLIADPVLDIANTIVLTTIPFKHLVSAEGQDFSSVDLEMIAELYLDTYRSQRFFDRTHLDYYRVMRSVNALLQGFEGQEIWQHPLIVKDLIEFIHEITDIRIEMPG